MATGWAIHNELSPIAGRSGGCGVLRQQYDSAGFDRADRIPAGPAEFQQDVGRETDCADIVDDQLPILSQIVEYYTLAVLGDEATVAQFQRAVREFADITAMSDDEESDVLFLVEFLEQLDYALRSEGIE